jgi:hypothetical protein
MEILFLYQAELNIYRDNITANSAGSEALFPIFIFLSKLFPIFIENMRTCIKKISASDDFQNK